MLPYRNGLKKLSILLLAVFFGNAFLLPDAQGFESSNYRGPFKGRVLDQDTKEPIEGAVVHVDWYMNHLFSRPTFFDAKEVLTDKNGNFYIPANWSLFPWRNKLISSNCMIFKVNYGYVEGYCGGEGELEVSILREMAEEMQKFTSEDRTKMGPGMYYNIGFEGDLALFLLKKLTPENTYRLPGQAGTDVFPHLGPDREAPVKKRRLLMEEINKERKEWGEEEFEIK